jgi:hypothetical protein
MTKSILQLGRRRQRGTLVGQGGAPALGRRRATAARAHAEQARFVTEDGRNEGGSAFVA